MQQHQRQQAERFGLREQLHQQPPEPNRFDRQIGSREVALIEHEVDHVQYCGETLGQVGARWYFVRNPRVPDLGLRAHNALRQRRGGREERGGDLLGRQTAHLAQRHPHLCVRIDARVAAGEDQTQPVVGDVVVLGFDHVLRDIELAGSLAPGLPKAIDGLEPAGRDQPRAGVRGCPLDRPALHRRRERILKRLLGEIEVAEQADQGREDAAGLRAINRLDRVYGWSNSMTGRTSTVPCCAPGIRDATWTASFRSFALIR